MKSENHKTSKKKSFFFLMIKNILQNFLVKCYTNKKLSWIHLLELPFQFSYVLKQYLQKRNNYSGDIYVWLVLCHSWLSSSQPSPPDETHWGVEIVDPKIKPPEHVLKNSLSCKMRGESHLSRYGKKGLLILHTFCSTCIKKFSIIFELHVFLEITF